MKKISNFVNGTLQSISSNELSVEDPSTGEEIAKVVLSSEDDFKKIIDSSFVPVVVLGGAAMGDDEALLKMVKMAMDSGASGIAVGRNVFQHENPALVAKSLHAIVHEDANLDQALKILNH